MLFLVFRNMRFTNVSVELDVVWLRRISLGGDGDDDDDDSHKNVHI